MARKEYDEGQKLEFIAVANEIGISPAMRELGYPGSHHTAGKWFEEFNIQLPDVSYLQRKARGMGVFYGDKEKITAAQLVIDRITDKLEIDSSSLDADAINKLSNALHRAIQTIQLIEGKATNISENHTKDTKDLAIQDLIAQTKAKNAIKAQEMIDISTT